MPAGSQPIPYTAAGTSSQQSCSDSAEVIGMPIPYRGIDTVSPESTHAGSNSTSSAESTSTPPRRRGGRKPSNNACPYPRCDRSFDRPSVLKNHMYTHTGVKGESRISLLADDFALNSVWIGTTAHKCRYCDSDITTGSNLQRHYNTLKCRSRRADT